jgi:hydrogenase-4 component B
VISGAGVQATPCRRFSSYPKAATAAPGTLPVPASALRRGRVASGRAHHCRVPVLIALVALLTALAGLVAAGVAAAVPSLRPGARWATLGICVAALPFAAWGALGPAAAVEVPVGLPGVSVWLALDPLGAFFLVPVLIAAAATAACGRDDAILPLPLFAAAMLFTLLAADGFALVMGFGATVALCWGFVLAGRRRSAGQLALGMALVGVVALAGAVALLAPPGRLLGDGLAFAAVRAAPPVGWRAGLALALALAGAGGTMGLVPLHLWLPPAQRAVPGGAGVMMSGAMTGVAAYVLVRVLLDLCGPATPAWWGVPLLVLGGISAVLGALRANLEADFRGVLAAGTVANSGFVAMALGAALAARGADLPALAALALGAALLLVLAHGVFKALLVLCAGAVGRGAGTHRLARLGGLVHTMPAVTLCTLVGAASLAVVPLSAGFTGEWLLLQALAAGSRGGEIGLQLVFALGVAAVGFAAALLAAAAVRLVGVAFLGRPRTPRAAAATEPPRSERLALAALAALTVLIGMVPALGLALADGAVRALAGVNIPRVGLLAVGPQAETPGYAPLGIVLLIALAAAGATAWLRMRAVPGALRGSAWEGGGSPPPPWLPFGDPATEYGPVSFAQPLLRTLGVLVLARQRLQPAEPGSPVPARSWLSWRDPCGPFLYRPAFVLRRRLSTLLDPLQHLTARGAVTLLAAVLAVLLAVSAALEAG